MTQNEVSQLPPPPSRPAGGASWTLRSWSRLAMAALVVVGFVIAWRVMDEARRMISSAKESTTITQEFITEKVRSVAQLVSTEMTVRDVVTYESTRYGSTKRALLVVTGRILAGVDLEKGTTVTIDSVARRITITMPEARILAVDIVRLQTYDEERGLWNPFKPEDRDEIYQRVRRQLHAAAADMGIVQRANRSAAQMLETMFSVSGYTAEVRFATGILTPPPG